MEKYIYNCNKCNNKFNYKVIFTSRNYCSKCIIFKINPYEQNNEILLELFIEKNKNQTFLNEQFTTNERTSNICLYFLESNKIYDSMNKYTLPLNFSLYINNTKINNDSKLNIDITAIIKVKETNYLQINHNNIKNDLLIVITKSKPNYLGDMTIGDNKLSYTKCLNKNLKYFSDFMIAREKFSIKCVYTYKLIQIPVKGMECKHFQCFDLQTFLKINKVKKRFVCPVCNSILFFDELYEDKFFAKIIQKYKCNKSKKSEFFIDYKGNIIDIYK